MYSFIIWIRSAWSGADVNPASINSCLLSTAKYLPACRWLELAYSHGPTEFCPGGDEPSEDGRNHADPPQTQHSIPPTFRGARRRSNPGNLVSASRTGMPARAPFCPYFLSLVCELRRVRKPSFLQRAARSMLNSRSPPRPSFAAPPVA